MYGVPGQLSSALLPLPGTMPARQPRVHGRQPPPRRAIIHTDTGARADRQTPGVVQCRHATSPSHARRHACTVIPPPTTTTPPHDGCSTTSSTHQPLLALSRHTHTHTHLPATAQRTIHAALNQQRHTRTRARSIRQPHRTLLPLLACPMKLYMRQNAGKRGLRAREE